MMKITNEYLKEELEDIINCIVNFDHTETLETKGRYFDIIQKDLKKLVKNNGVLDDVIVTDCPKCNYKLHPSGQCVNQFCSGWSKKSSL